MNNLQISSKLFLKTTIALIAVINSSLGLHPLAKSNIIQTKLDTTEYDLPKFIIPLQYEIKISPEFETETYTGSEKIHIQVLENTEKIIVHSFGLKINESLIQVVDSNNNQYTITNTTELNDIDQQFFVIYLAEELQAGQIYTLIFGSFENTFNSEPSGFYLRQLNDYKDDENKRFIAFTKFEPVGARRVFPCFDEPIFKATFILSIVRPENYTTLSSTSVRNYTFELEISILENNEILEEFEETPLMSTSSLTIVITDFVKIQEKEKNITNIFITDSSKELYTNYALSQSRKIIETFENLLEFSYPLDKFNFVFMPDEHFDFQSISAWGVAVLRESLSFYSNDSTTEEDKILVSRILAHEIIYQWFGNLIVPQSWKYLWLSTGLSTYFEFYITSLINTEWDIMEYFVSDIVQSAFQYDSIFLTRPMNQDTGNFRETEGLYDVIAYDKAAAVVRMMDSVLSTPIFLHGIKNYLKEQSYFSTNSSDLTHYFQEEVDKNDLLLNISLIVSSWESTPGFPVIYVDRNYTDGSININQSRFNEDDSNYKSYDLWQIPITYAVQSDYNFSNTQPDFWLTSIKARITLMLNSSDWLILNKNQLGYYRVNYDLDNWYLLINYLKTEDFENVPVSNRAQLIDDAFALAKSGRLNFNIVLKLSEYLSQETHLVPFTSFLRNIDYIRSMLAFTEANEKFQNFVIDILQPIFEKLSLKELENDTSNEIRLRPKIIKFLCNMANSTCRENSLEMLKEWKTTGTNSMSVNTEENIICGALKNGNLEDWNFVFQKYEESNNIVRKKRYFNALGCSENQDTIEMFLDFLVNQNSTVTENQKLKAFETIYSSSNVGLNTVLGYIQNNLDNISQSIDTCRLMKGIAKYLNTAEQLEKVENLRIVFEDFSEAIENALFIINDNIEKKEFFLPEINNYFEKYEFISTNNSSFLSASSQNVISWLFLIILNFCFYFFFK